MPRYLTLLMWISLLGALAFATLWMLRESSLIALERPDDLLTPTLALGVSGLALKGILDRHKKRRPKP